jgi:hypothetical protein
MVIPEEESSWHVGEARVERMQMLRAKAQVMKRIMI